jgi:30S ribosomal protein S31
LLKLGRTGSPAFLFSAGDSDAWPGHCGQSRRGFLDFAALKGTLENLVGKGDRRTRRGKIYAGSFGKSRPKAGKAKSKAKAKVARPAAVKAAPAVKPAAKAPARRKSG